MLSIDEERRELTKKFNDSKIGKLVHIGVDLALVSGFLAGIKRHTGVTPDLRRIQNDDLKNFTKKYLDLGETFFDFSLSFLGSTSFFKRN